MPVANTMKSNALEVIPEKKHEKLLQKIALIDWSFLMEDYLDNIGSTIEAFCRETTGGWMFGYIEALKTKNVETILFCFSARVNKIQQYVHQPTGATIIIIPASKKYRWSRKHISNPYATSLMYAAGNIHPFKKPFYKILHHLSHYWATPFRLLYKTIKKENVQLILCQEYESPRFDICVLIARLLRLPIFATFQGGSWQMSWLEKYIRPVSLKYCSGFIAGAAEEVKRLKEKYKIQARKIAGIANPIDLNTWCSMDKKEARSALQIPLHAKVIIWHGRIDYHRKGLDILLNAWEQLTGEKKDVALQLILIGNGIDAATLRDHLNRLQLKNIIWIDEYINDRGRLSQYLHAADIYAFPSRHEGFPVAPIEAMACGLPVVALDTSGVSEILGEEETRGGVMVANGDTVAFKEGLKMLIDNKDLCTQMAERARKRVEMLYSSEAVGEQLFKFLFKPANQ